MSQWLSLAAALFVYVLLGSGCGGGSAEGKACDDLCSAAGYDSVDEVVDADGLTCSCLGALGAELTDSACATYCTDTGGDEPAVVTTSFANDSCRCGVAP